MQSSLPSPAQRGRIAIDDIGIIPRHGGIIVHDCWASYFSYENCEDALCGSYLLRELEFCIDSDDYAWSRNIKQLLQDTCSKVSARKRKKLTRAEYAMNLSIDYPYSLILL